MPSQAHESWAELLSQYDLEASLDELYRESSPVYPPRQDCLRIFRMPIQEIRLVFLGQDPYHGPGQAHGLAFSVPSGIPAPPSLQNIFKELAAEFPERAYAFSKNHGNLTTWVDREKIFLFNTALTVLEGKAGSHAEVWQEFTDDVIKFIAAKNKKCVFLLLGNHAKSKTDFIEKSRVVVGIHPSPLSAHRGFFGSGIFQAVEKVLGQSINWQN